MENMENQDIFLVHVTFGDIRKIDHHFKNYYWCLPNIINFKICQDQLPLWI